MQTNEELLNKAYNTLFNINGALYILYKFCKYYESDELMMYIIPLINYIKKDADKTYCEIFNSIEGIEEE